jgi:hypothetical protein
MANLFLGVLILTGFAFLPGDWFSIKNAIMLSGLSLVFCVYLDRKFHFTFGIFAAWLLIPSVWIWASTSRFSTTPGVEMIQRFSMSQSCFYFVLITFVISRLKAFNIELIRKALFLFSVVNSLFTIGQFILGIKTAGFLGEISMNGCINGLLAPIGLFWGPWPWKALTVINVVAVVLSQSTTAAMVLMAGLFLWIMQSNLKSRSSWILFSLFSMLGIGLIINDGNFFNPGDRFIWQRNYLSQLSATDLIFGIGNGTFLTNGLILSRKLGNPQIWLHLHSGLLRLVWESGLIGVAFAVPPVVVALRKSWREPLTRNLFLTSILFGCIQYPEFLPFHCAVVGLFLLSPFRMRQDQEFDIIA